MAGAHIGPFLGPSDDEFLQMGSGRHRCLASQISCCRSGRERLGPLRFAIFSRRHLPADGPGATIYQLDKVHSFAPFTVEEPISEAITATFDPVNGVFLGARGVYPAEGQAAWVKPDFALIFRWTVQVRFVLSIFVPPELLEQVAHGDPLRLRISSPECLDSSVSIAWRGPQTITLPLACPPAFEPN